MPRNTVAYDHLVAFALEHPWAITPNMLTLIAGVLAGRMAGDAPDAAALLLAQELKAAREVPVATGGSVRVIPVFGVIAPRMNLLSEMSGGTTFDALSKQLADAVADPNVKAVVFDVDSPGGNVAGASEFARAVLKARATKPVFAQAQYLMASAAYHPMACATEVIASPSAMIGAIGVYSIYDDLTDALQQLGVKREVFVAGKYKAEGVGGTGLTDDARAHIGALIDGAYQRMVGDIAKGRGCSAADVRSGFGEGRLLNVEQAKDAGLIDRVGTLQDTLARASTARPPLPSPAATDQDRPAAVDTSQEPRAKDDATTAIAEYEQQLLSVGMKGHGR
jgi:signal peptide peptidase SppA